MAATSDGERRVAFDEPEDRADVMHERIADLEATITDLQRTRRQFQSLVDQLEDLGPDPAPAERTGASGVAAPGDD